jgi:hypothetical protein
MSTAWTFDFADDVNKTLRGDCPFLRIGVVEGAVVAMAKGFRSAFTI